MVELTKEQRRSRNADLLKKNSLWVCGDGVPFPYTNEGLKFARKWARMSKTSIHLEKQSVEVKPKTKTKKTKK